MNRVDGKVALVTGAARGIGAETARLLASAGAEVFVSDVLVEEGCAVAEGIGAAGGRSTFLPLDVRREEEWQRTITEIDSRAGRLDILVNNAGVELVKPIEELTLEEWQWISAINLDGVFLGTRAAVGLMKKEEGGAPRGGSIINLSSVAGIIGTAFQTAYNMTKGGVRLFTKSAALEFAALGYNVRVNSVHPGVIKTDMGDLLVRRFAEVGGQSEDEVTETIMTNQPLGWGQVSDVAKAILFLASDDSRFMTGSELVVDGGLTAH